MPFKKGDRIERKLGGARATVLDVTGGNDCLTVEYDDPESQHWTLTFSHYFDPVDVVTCLGEVAG
jgi:hypothetical protein